MARKTTKSAKKAKSKAKKSKPSSKAKSAAKTKKAAKSKSRKSKASKSKAGKSKAGKSKAGKSKAEQEGNKASKSKAGKSKTSKTRRARPARTSPARPKPKGQQEDRRNPTETAQAADHDVAAGGHAAACDTAYSVKSDPRARPLPGRRHQRQCAVLAETASRRRHDAGCDELEDRPAAGKISSASRSSTREPGGSQFFALNNRLSFLDALGQRQSAEALDPAITDPEIPLGAFPTQR